MSESAPRAGGLTLNEIRPNGFWIVVGSSVVRSHLYNWVICRKLESTFQEQKMVGLPEDRPGPAPPFTNCAVDFIGPRLLKQGRKEGRRYGVLFTCMASRAIHLEVFNRLGTDSFINAFFCFITPIMRLVYMLRCCVLIYFYCLILL